MAQQFYRPQRSSGKNNDDAFSQDEGWRPGKAQRAQSLGKAAGSLIHDMDDLLGEYKAQGHIKHSDSDEDSSKLKDFAMDKLKREESVDDTIGNGYDDEPDKKSKKKRQPFSVKNMIKNKLLWGIGGGGGIVGLLVGVFIGLLPAHIKTVVTQAVEQGFANATSAESGEIDNLLKGYIVSSVLPGYSKCGTTVSRACTSVYPKGNNPVAGLYKAWRADKIENKLADAGIEIRKNSDGTWEIKTPNTKDGTINIGQDGEKLDGEWKRVDRAGFRAEVRKATADKTFWKKIATRYQIGKVAEHHYGINRCIFACKTKDEITLTKEQALNSAKLAFTQKVLIPRTETSGVAIKCILDPGCQPYDTKDRSSDPVDNGAPESDTDKEANDTFRQLARENPGVDSKALQETYDQITKDGIQKYATTEILKKIVPEAAATATSEALTKAAPVVGWIQLFAQIVNAANSAGPAFVKLSFALNSAAAVQTYQMMSTYNDEVQAGNGNLAVMGQMTSLLDGGYKGDANNPIQVGGTAADTESPIYDMVMNGGSYQTSKDYTCSNDKVPDSGKLCDEENFASGNSIANTIHDALNNPKYGGPILLGLVTVWNDTVGKVFDVVNWVMGHIVSLGTKQANIACDGGGIIPQGGFNFPVIQDIDTFKSVQKHYDINIIGDAFAAPLVFGMPLYCTMTPVLQDMAPLLIQFASKFLIPNPFGQNMSGARMFDMIFAGAGALGSQYAHQSLGGRALSPQEASAIQLQQQQDNKLNFQAQPLYARLFSTDSPYSLASRVALTLPGNPLVKTSSVISSTLSDPFGKVSSAFSGLFGSKKASALNNGQTTNSFFGIPDYGYTQSDLDAIGDSGTYWDNHCSDYTDTNVGDSISKWNDAAADNIDQSNQLPTNTNTEPCLLIKRAVEAAGGYSDSSLLPKDTNPFDSASDSGTAGAPSGDQKQLAQQIVDLNKQKKILFESPSDLQDFQNTVDGKPSTCTDEHGTVTLSTGIAASLSSVLIQLAQKHTLQISAVFSGHGGSDNNGCSDGGRHPMGRAADITRVDNIHVFDGGNVAADRAFAYEVLGYLPKGKFVGGVPVGMGGLGQEQCFHPGLEYPAGINHFEDSCSHLHVDVGAKDAGT